MQRKKLSAYVSAIIAIGASLGLSGCDATGDKATASKVVHPQASSIKINQLGYLPNASKVAVIPTLKARSFTVLDTSGQLVKKGKSSPPKLSPLSGESIAQIDLTDINTVGQYTLSVEGIDEVAAFEVVNNRYEDLHKATLKAYYFNRAGLAITPELGGDFARAMGHPDTEVVVHASAASDVRPEGTVLSSPKGWYDAGDYNKYIVNSGISTYTLLQAFSQHADYYNSLELNIPESNNNKADILDEIAWNLEWMSTMQDPNDGGVYHKLTTLNFSGIIMPEEGKEPRYVVQKTTTAALNFAAVLAKASRVYTDINPTLSEQYSKQALAAFKWASANPAVPYRQPEDVSTGQYEDEYPIDEFAWAAAELYLMTESNSFLTSFNNVAVTPDVPSWSNSSALGYISLLFDGKDLLPEQDYDRFKNTYLILAKRILKEHQESAYPNSMTEVDYVWGSNGVAMNKAMVMFQAYNLTGDAEYQIAGEGLLNYALGTNPTGYSYVTGFGKITPMHPHHRPSEADDVVAPVPGFLVGGPHSGQQDKCDYVSDLPAQSYVDHWCSYASNEVTINWNAPLVFALAHMQAKHQ
jgi:endoglucanase